MTEYHLFRAHVVVWFLIESPQNEFNILSQDYQLPQVVSDLFLTTLQLFGPKSDISWAVFGFPSIDKALRGNCILSYFREKHKNLLSDHKIDRV